LPVLSFFVSLQKNLLNTIKIIDAKDQGWRKLQLKKIWQYRALLVNFALRDIKTQYAQTKLGIVWSFLQAMTAGVIIFFFFGWLIKVTVPGNIPYIVYAYPGMMAWYFFSFIISQAGTSLQQSQDIIKKVYFPKLILPLSKSIVGLVDFAIWFIFYIVILLIYQFPLSYKVVFLPIGILFNIIAGFSVAIWLSALTVRFRDFYHIIPYLVGFGIFITPVFFPTALLPESLHFFIYINPMAGVIALIRWCLLDTELSVYYLIGLIPTLLLFISGVYYFRRVEGIMADII